VFAVVLAIGTIGGAMLLHRESAILWRFMGTYKPMARFALGVLLIIGTVHDLA
jgi:hypothetical protein